MIQFVLAALLTLATFASAQPALFTPDCTGDTVTTLTQNIDVCTFGDDKGFDID